MDKKRRRVIRILLTIMFLFFVGVVNIEAAGMIKPMPVKTLKEMVEGESRTSLDVRDFAGYDAKYAAYLKELIELHPDAGLSLEELREKYTLDWFGEEYGFFEDYDVRKPKKEIKGIPSFIDTMSEYQLISLFVAKFEDYDPRITGAREHVFRRIKERELDDRIRKIIPYACRSDVLEGVNWSLGLVKNLVIEIPNYLEVVRFLLDSFPRSLKYMPYEIRDDEGMVRIACERSPSKIEYATNRIRDNEEFAVGIIGYHFKKNNFKNTQEKYSRIYQITSGVSPRLKQKYSKYSREELVRYFERKVND